MRRARSRLVALGLGLLASSTLLASCTAEPAAPAPTPPVARPAADPPVRTVEAPGGVVEVSFGAGRLDLSEAAILEWIRKATRAVSGYLGRFPVARATVLVLPAPGAGVANGVAGADGQASIRVDVGEHTTQDQLDDDWIMTHEMLHLGFPTVRHRWLEEGLATYVEPLARARAGQLAPERVWSDMLSTYAQGLALPGAPAPGLDHDGSWATTYYGGAIFCLEADVAIRRGTKNARGLEHALRGILEAGGVISETWPIERALATGDRATGVAVLEPLYARSKDAPVRVDLDALWKELGVELVRGRVVFHDDAPLASVRRALTGS